MTTPKPSDLSRRVPDNKVEAEKREVPVAKMENKPSFERKPHLTDHPLRNHPGLKALKESFSNAVREA